jgi:hypothetical protein
MMMKAMTGEVSDDKTQEEKKGEEAGDLYPSGDGALRF